MTPFRREYPWERPTMEDFLQRAHERFHIFNIKVEELTRAIQSACSFFGIPYPNMVYDLTNVRGGETMFVNYNRASYGDDVLCYNLTQLRDLGVSSAEAFSLVMTHECAHRYFQCTQFPGLNNGSWEQELACDFFMGVRSMTEQIVDIQKVANGLGCCGGSRTHPDGQLRVQAIAQGQRTVLYFQENNIAFTMPNFTQAFFQYCHSIAPTIYAREQQYM